MSTFTSYTASSGSWTLITILRLIPRILSDMLIRVSIGGKREGEGGGEREDRREGKGKRGKKERKEIWGEEGGRRREGGEKRKEGGVKVE